MTRTRLLREVRKMRFEEADGGLLELIERERYHRVIMVGRDARLRRRLTRRRRPANRHEGQAIRRWLAEAAVVMVSLAFGIVTL